MPIQSKVISTVVKSRIVPSKRIVADTLISGQSLGLADLSDVDLTNLNDGALLVYDENSHKFVATNTIDNDNLTLFGGTF